MAYSALELPGIDEQVIESRKYLKGNSDYRKNSFTPVDNQLRERSADLGEDVPGVGISGVTC